MMAFTDSYRQLIILLVIRMMILPVEKKTCHLLLDDAVKKYVVWFEMLIVTLDIQVISVLCD